MEKWSQKLSWETVLSKEGGHFPDVKSKRDMLYTKHDADYLLQNNTKHLNVPNKLLGVENLNISVGFLLSSS